MRTKEQEVARFTYLKTADVATRLNVSRSHVVDLIQAGALVAIDVALGGRPDYRIAPAALDAFEALRRVDEAA